jgi:hypothetical protein
MTKLELTYLGTHWPWGGDLFSMTRADGKERARVFVDDLGETWVDIRRERGFDKEGYLRSERIEAFRSYGNAAQIEARLREMGFDNRRNADFAYRVRQRDI